MPEWLIICAVAAVGIGQVCIERKPITQLSRKTDAGPVDIGFSRVDHGLDFTERTIIHNRILSVKTEAATYHRILQPGIIRVQFQTDRLFKILDDTKIKVIGILGFEIRIRNNDDAGLGIKDLGYILLVRYPAYRKSIHMYL